MLIVINGKSHGARGTERWSRVRDALPSRAAYEEVLSDSIEASNRAIVDAIARGHDVIVAAGGDGTMNAALNALMDPATDRPRGDVALGGVGLGSSNDFHKPLAKERTIAGFPARMSRRSGARVDVGKAVLHHPDGSASTRYFLLNASVGIVAEGNAFFNDGDRMLRLLKKDNTEAAILYAAISKIVKNQTLSVKMDIDGDVAFDAPVANIGVLKSVYFAGGMRYDTPVKADDGHFDVVVWKPMSRRALLGTMARLYRAKFSGQPDTECLRGRNVSITPSVVTHLELDGEIFNVSSATLSVLPSALLVCG
jgi:diacylglycerol kinase family enzyme